jgi:CBS domain-containing protein
MRPTDRHGIAGAGRRRAALTMYSPLSDIVGREPVTVPLYATVRTALEIMERLRVGSIVVTDRERRFPVGIFTLRDHVRRVTLPGGDLAQPVASVMTSGLITLTPQASAHQAALLMARSGVNRIVVVEEDGRLVGVVSQTDLFGLQQVGVREISAEIQQARDVESLRVAARGIRRLALGLLDQGIGAETLTQFVSTLNDLLTIRIIEATADEIERPPVPMCWIALGSEGRLEQTFSTDQDNGIIFEAPSGEAEQVRAALVPFARAVNEKLDACGFPLCQGGVMASNPEWCLTLEEWQEKFSRWIHAPAPKALLNAAIFFDLRPIHGREALAERLRAWLLGAASERTLFLRFMAENALECQPALGTFRDFVTDRSKEFPHTINLKTHGSRPFVDAARVLALAHRVPHTSTAERLRGIDEVVSFGEERLSALVDGFYFIHLLRLRRQGRPGTSVAGANRVDPRALNDLDRRVLKEAFKQARALQSRLRLDYGL